MLLKDTTVLENQEQIFELFPCIKAPQSEGGVMLSQLLQRIDKGEYKEKHIAYRLTPDDQKLAYRNNSLPCFRVGGLNSPQAKISLTLQHYNKVIAFKLTGIIGEPLESLHHDKHTFALIHTLSINEFVLLVLTGINDPSDQAQRDQYAMKLTLYLQEYHGLLPEAIKPLSPSSFCWPGEKQHFMNPAAQPWFIDGTPVQTDKAFSQTATLRDKIDRLLIQQVETEMEHLSEQKLEFVPTIQGQQVGPFPIEAFPDLFQPIIQQTSLHMNFRPDWIGSAILYAASVAVGNCYATRYKDYSQKALLYLAIVGMPGTNKSGPLEYAIKPLRHVDKIAYRKYIQQKAEKLAANLPSPIYQTTLVSDVTQEFLVQTMENNPIGLGLLMDELAGWFKNFTRYNKGSEEQFWLSVWSFSPVKSGRKASGVQHIDNPYLSVAGTIQPGVLSELAKDGRSQNGFIDRILFAYPDDQQKNKDSDTELDPSITKEYYRLIDKLLTLRQGAVIDEYGSVETNWIPFAPDAFDRMRQWRDDNTDRSNQTPTQALKGIYAKFDAYCIRFALLIELMKWACDQSDLTRIRLDSVERAIVLADYFRQNAEKVYNELRQQSPIGPLSPDRQRLFNALSNQITTAEAIDIGKDLTPPVSESTVKRLLSEDKFFKQVKHGVYSKLAF
ncbi:DUF3987 domain-containing protein [Spirosoma sp. KCTC 42546]|uniref:DUF3987 domain-containing protein n=1 Tax=Spirosoma sp. KCTC 42546 TaxID=2520506 RepID=UPI0011582016|nr:DUF3987 domain-containing protein [Spirosoma sp. KCTC 42546]QDK81564.1 DUF3987 domain-containing protein [Spirosoma sp. KCTC 42546]